jgi:hypothetical protein
VRIRSLFRFVSWIDGGEVLAESAAFPDISGQGTDNDSDQQEPCDTGDGGGDGSEGQAGEGADTQAIEHVVRLPPGWEARRSGPAHSRLIVPRGAVDS